VYQLDKNKRLDNTKIHRTDVKNIKVATLKFLGSIPPVSFNIGVIFLNTAVWT